MMRLRGWIAFTFLLVGGVDYGLVALIFFKKSLKIASCSRRPQKNDDLLRFFDAMKTSRLRIFVGRSNFLSLSSLLVILMFFQKSRSRSRHPQNFVDFLINLSLIYVLKMMFLKCCFSIAQV